MDPIHFSDLKKMALSPAHFRCSVAESFEATRNMRIGTIVHHMVLGGNKRHPVMLFDGESRRGKEWERFAEMHAGFEIVTAPEWREADPIAEAVKADPCARQLLEGARFEVPLTWTDAGIPCETHGLDIVAAHHVADLKVTSCTEPRTWMRHATKLLYHAQMAWYERACQANSIDVTDGMFLIGVESSPPYAVTCLRLGPDVLLQGHKSCAIWMERLRTCLENDHWPTYTQTVLDFELPAWASDEAAEAAEGVE